MRCRNLSSGGPFTLDKKITGPKQAVNSRGQCNAVVYQVVGNKFGKGHVGQRHKVIG